MRVCYNAMARYQPTPAAPEPTELFEKWMRHTLDAANMLMPFQSARYTAIGIRVEDGKSPLDNAGDVTRPVDYPSHGDIVRTLRARGLPPLLELLDGEIVDGEIVEGGGNGRG
jgi:hypothetical protein